MCTKNYFGQLMHLNFHLVSMSNFAREYGIEIVNSYKRRFLVKESLTLVQDNKNFPLKTILEFLKPDNLYSLFNKILINK